MRIAGNVVFRSHAPSFHSHAPSFCSPMEPMAASVCRCLGLRRRGMSNAQGACRPDFGALRCRKRACARAAQALGRLGFGRRERSGLPNRQRQRQRRQANPRRALRVAVEARVDSRRPRRPLRATLARERHAVTVGISVSVDVLGAAPRRRATLAARCDGRQSHRGGYRARREPSLGNRTGVGAVRGRRDGCSLAA